MVRYYDAISLMFLVAAQLRWSVVHVSGTVVGHRCQTFMTADKQELEHGTSQTCPRGIRKSCGQTC